jgi:lipopolysaccharide transport system permease protein
MRAAFMPNGLLIRRFVGRELRNRFAGSLWGGFWALFQPLLQLAIMSFVFVRIFSARVPGLDASSYAPFLAVALWPWTAFADGVLRATTSIQENAALIGKVAVPRELLVLSSVAASFLIHVAGFIAVVVVLAFMGTGIRLGGLLPALLLYVPLVTLVAGLALICAALQVFVRDLSQALGQLLPLLMYCAPVFYDRMQVPPAYRSLFDLNPFTFYAETFRAILLDHGTFDGGRLLVACAIALGVLLVGHVLFRRLKPHFEDFL